MDHRCTAADGFQQRSRIFCQQKKRYKRRRFLQREKQGILCLRRHGMGIFQYIKFPFAIIGCDIQTLPHMPDLLHADGGFVSVGDPEYVGGNIL